MLASRLGIAALILIGLYGLLALQPFGPGTVPEGTANAEVPITDDVNFSLEELPTGEPAIQLNTPEGQETYVLRRLPNGEMAITRADEAVPGASQAVDALPEPEALPPPDPTTETLRGDLDRAREAAMTALAELNQAQSAYDAAESEDTDGSEGAAQDEAFEEMVLSALQNSKLREEKSSRTAPPTSQPELVEQIQEERAQELEELQMRLQGSAQPPQIAPAPLESQYAGKMLMGESFAGQDLSGMSFRRSVLTGADFTGAKLIGADFSGAKLQGAYFNGANLIDADMRGVSAQAAKFKGADLRRTNLENANFTGTDLTQADLRGAQLAKINLNGAVSQGAKFDPISVRAKKRKSLPVTIR